jgi:hypothetical protein
VALETEPFWEPATALDAAWVPMAAGDFNGDAKDDIVWRHHTTGRVIVWYMDHYIRVGTAVIWPASTPADAAWIPMASGDFNGDARPDLVWRNLTTGRVIIWYMDGVTRTGTIAIWEPATAADQAWVPLTADDFNHDSKPDLIWRNETSGRCIIWFMDGATRTGTFALWPATNWGDPLWRPMGTGDFNHDGETDIVWRNIITGEVFLKYYVGTTLTTSAMLWGNPAPF